MTSSTDTVIAALETFEPLDDSDNFRRLYRIFDGFGSLADREKAMPAMFSVLERYPDAELGSPGPLVHELEAIAGYRQLLKASLAVKPTYLTVWMVNRVLNSKLEATERQTWLGLLHAAAKHPQAVSSAREAANDFIRHQAERSNA